MLIGENFICFRQKTLFSADDGAIPKQRSSEPVTV